MATVTTTAENVAESQMQQHQQQHQGYISPLSPPEIFTANVLNPIRIATLPVDGGACIDIIEKSILSVIEMERSLSRGDIAISARLEIQRLTMLAQIEFLATNPMSPVIVSCSEHPQTLYGYVQSLFELGLRICNIQ